MACVFVDVRVEMTAVFLGLRVSYARTIIALRNASLL